MRSRDEIFRDAESLIHTEVLHNANFRKTWSGDSAKARVDAIANLMPLLREAAKLQDIALLLEIEQRYLVTELTYLVHTRESRKSFNLALLQVRAALEMLRRLILLGDYRADEYYTLPDNTVVGGLPKDEAHQFFASHATRLGNRLKEPPPAEMADLLRVRVDNLKVARDIYEDMQRQVLAVSEASEPAPEIREPLPGSYRPTPAAREIREPTKPYLSERKLRPAA